LAAKHDALTGVRVPTLYRGVLYSAPLTVASFSATRHDLINHDLEQPGRGNVQLLAEEVVPQAFSGARAANDPLAANKFAAQITVADLRSLRNHACHARLAQKALLKSASCSDIYTPEY
jgi:hypothetical protein